MDPDSPTTRVERTFWTVWYYITAAVSRFIRPEPANIPSNDLNSIQKSAVDSEPANVGHIEDDASRKDVNEEQPLATTSLLSSSRPLVAWDLCTTDIDLGPDKESMPYETHRSACSESKASGEGEGTREEQFPQVGYDAAAGLLVAREDKQEETRDQKLSTGRQDEKVENSMYEEHANTGSLRLTGDVMSEDVEESKIDAGAEGETKRATTLEDPQKMSETMEVKEADDKMQHEDEEDLQTEDTEVSVCPITDLSLEEEDYMHTEEGKVQRNKEDTAVMHEEVENSNGVPQLTSENDSKSDEGKQVENQLSFCAELSDDDRDVKEDRGSTSLQVELQIASDKSGITSKDERIVVEGDHAMAHKSESAKAEDVKEEEDERAQGAVLEEEDVSKATNNQTRDEAPDQEDNIKTVTEDSQPRDIFTVTCCDEVMQNAKAELHTAEFAEGEQHHMGEDTDVQTKARETDDDETESHSVVSNKKSHVTATHIPIDERFFDKDQEEEERLSSKVGKKESYMEIACTATSVTARPEGEIGQKISGGFKNIPLGICEGRVVVLQELNFPTCEETQEGVPGYNNEPGPDETDYKITTQRFLEDCEEIQGSQLPEEVESKELESLQNSGTGADYLLVREHLEEEQEGAQDIKNRFDPGLPQETEKPFVVESGHLSEEEEGELLIDSMKTGLEQSEEEFESDVELTDGTHKLVRDGTEELLIDFEIDEGSCSIAEDGSETTGAVTTQQEVRFSGEIFLEAEVQKMTEMSFFRESVDATNSEQNSNMTPGLLEDITESGFLKRSDDTGPKLLEDAQMQDTGIDMEEAAEPAEDEMQNKNEMEILHLAESESSGPVESQKMKYQRLDETFEVSNEEMLTDTEATDELKTAKPKDLNLMSIEVTQHATESEESYAGETVCSMSGHQDVIDNKILDLWLQAALSEDGIKQQEEPEPGQQTEPVNEKQDEVSSVQMETDKEQLVELNSRELVSDTEVSSSTVESGFLDQSLSEWGAQTVTLLKSGSTGSFQGGHDMLANMSDVSELSVQQPNSESQAKLMEEAAEMRQSHLKEEETITGVSSPEGGHLNQELDKSREETDEERVESAETETVSQKEIDVDWKDAEEADAKSLTGMNAPFKVEKTYAEDKPLEVTVSDSPDQIKHNKSRSGSEASLDEEIMLTESGSQSVTCTESEKKSPSVDKLQPRWSADVAELLPGLNEAEMAGQPTTTSEEQMEVNTSALDFTAQKSRISVKNPLVRPPKDPRSLLHMPSLEPSPRLSAKVPAGVPLGGLGIGIKLPGLGAGFPVLKKTQQVMREDNSPEALSKDTKSEETSDTPKQDEAKHKPKWMPPRHPGFGNPLMSELKTKLKKTTKE